MSSLLTLEQQQKDFLKSTSIRIFLFISYSFGIETVSIFIHSCKSFENHSRFLTKMDKVCTRFQTKTAQNPALWGDTKLP